METTYVMIKPDGVQRGLVGEIVQRFERKGLQLVGLKQVIPSEEIAKEHYAVHSERPFFPGLIIMLVALSLNLLSSWLRIVLDPRERWRLEDIGDKSE